MLAIANPRGDGISLFEDATCPEGLQKELRHFQSCLSAFGIGRFLGARVVLSGNREVGLGLHAHADGPDLSADAREFLLSVMPHVQEALRLIEKAKVKEIGNSAITETLEILQQPMAVVRKNGEIIYANKAGRTLLIDTALISASEGSRLQTRDKLTNLVEHITRRKASSSGCRFEADGQILQVQYRWIDQVVDRWFEDSPSEPLIMLAFSTGGVRTDIGASHLRAFFDITHSEAELLAALCAGNDVAGFARSRNVSIHTARSQLKRLMSKTDARRQSDLIRMALNTPAMCLRQTQ